jgi:hypothetical protein
MTKLDNLITSPNERTHSLKTRRVNLTRLIVKVCGNGTDKIEPLGGKQLNARSDERNILASDWRPRGDSNPRSPP